MVNDGRLLFVSDRLEKEKEILEQRADRRVEILQNLVGKTVNLSNNPDEKKVTFLKKRNALHNGSH